MYTNHLSIILLLLTCISCSKPTHEEFEAFSELIYQYAEKHRFETHLNSNHYGTTNMTSGHGFIVIYNITNDYNETTNLNTYGFNYDGFNKNMSFEEFESWYHQDGVRVNLEMIGNDYFQVFPDGSTSSIAFEETELNGKDLEKMGSLQEMLMLKSLTDEFSSEFGLSEERSHSLARLINNWKKISNRRTMTESDANLFLDEAIGSSYKKLKDAIKSKQQGNLDSYDQLIEKAAEVNHTYPEAVTELISELLIN